MEIFDRLAHITKHSWQDQANYWLLEGGMTPGEGYMRTFLDGPYHAGFCSGEYMEIPHP